MKLDLLLLTKIAIKSARSAGEVIQEYMNDNVAVKNKASGSSLASQVVTVVDTECEAAILSHLLPTCKTYDIALLSEETEDDGSRFEKDFFWCVDPMDGTLAFINKHPGFSVSIALVAKDGTPIIGVIFDPTTNTMYHAIKGMGAFKNNKAWSIKNVNPFLTYVTDRKLSDTTGAAKIKDLINKNLKKLKLTDFKEVSGGGAVLNSILVIENGPAFMLKFPKNEKGGGCIWDYAAAACIYQELGLTTTEFEGNKLDLNKKDDAFMNHKGVYFSSF